MLWIGDARGRRYLSAEKFLHAHNEVLDYEKLLYLSPEMLLTEAARAMRFLSAEMLFLKN